MILPSLLSFLFLVCSANGIDVKLYTQKVYRNVSPRFINVAFDTGVVKNHWENFRPKSTSVQTLAAALSPCYLRVGGTDADFLIFQNDKASGGSKVDLHGMDINHVQMKKYLQAHSTGSFTRYRKDIEHLLNGPRWVNFTMTATFYDQLHKFVSSVGWDLIFDLNSLLRKPDGAWDSSNAIELINYTAESGYKMGGWELGNEPDEYIGLGSKFVAPEQLATDFKTLTKLLRSYPSFADCQILGPDISAMTDYWRKGYFYSFLSSGGGDVVTAATFHQYYEDGDLAKVEDFYNPDLLNTLHQEIQTGVNLTKAAGSSAKVCLGETTSVWGIGTPNISDRYIAAFMWLDKLGMSARDGIDSVIRQAFYGRYFSLLDPNTLAPTPDYWLTLVYKLLVGSRVIRVTSPDSSGKLRVYAHCTETVKSGYPAGSVTVFVMNLDESSTMVEFSQFPSGTQLHLYTMTPPDKNITSKFPADREEVDLVKLGFYRRCGIPNVVGAIDGTLVPIIAPATNPDFYICRKGYHALNIQAVVDSNMRFIDAVCKWPGSQHDAAIFESCGLKEHLEENNIGHLLGDSGYPLRRFLITPIASPSTDKEVKYNLAHGRGRVVVEKAFGILKARFRAVKLNGILLQMKDERTLPNLLIPVKVTDFVYIEALTYTFIVLPDAKLKICL